MIRQRPIVLSLTNLLKKIAEYSIFALILLSPIAHAVNTTSTTKLPKSLTFSTSSHAAVEHYYQPLIQAAYQRLGIDIEFLQLNEERSIRLLDQGLLDGDTIRTENIHKSNSHFIPVQMLGEARIYLVCQPHIECNANLLEQKKFSLGSVGGSSHFDDLLADSEITQLRYTNYHLLKTSFEQGKIDAYIEIISAHYHQQAFPQKANTAYLETIHGFHYLHESHARLAPQVAAAIKEIQNQIHKEDDSCWKAFQKPSN
ncbi:hypothetical protein [Alteromonas sp. a30]|uniref:hypothetical protein n=1 Tax=Alteromonas sp. a30 TaxID=2730917 RepID=UPI00227E45E6|nr:hypothetical protein [Alteromonas sp. a30]MCY7295564.1 hypothetical protein [Alteromonas sp. a30]